MIALSETHVTLLRGGAINAEYVAGIKAGYSLLLHEVRGEQILYRRDHTKPFNPLVDVDTAVQLLIDARGVNIALSVTIDDDGVNLYLEPTGLDNPKYSDTYPTVQQAIVYGIIQLL